jgi:HrpA-like RNA helicase
MADDVQRETENLRDAFALASARGWARKIILATDVAETGVTISDLKFVIDLGYNNFVFQNPCIDARIMINQFPESQDQFDQRSGRVGRTSDGTAFALFPQSIYESKLRAFKYSGLETGYYFPLYMWLLQ